MTIPTLPAVVLKFAPYAAIAALVALLYLCHGKVGSLKATVTARSAQVATLTTQRDFFATAVSQRDAAIARQNASIEALEAAAAADRTVYLKGLEAARVVSADHQKAAAQLLALTAPEGELAQCRAARSLLESELVGQ